MALREAHSGSTVRNQAGPMGSKSPVGDIKGLGKKERDRRRRNKKREVRKASKAVAGADLRREVETLSETVTAGDGAVKNHQGDSRSSATCVGSGRRGRIQGCLLGRRSRQGQIGTRARSEAGSLRVGCGMLEAWVFRVG